MSILKSNTYIQHHYEFNSYAIFMIRDSKNNVLRFTPFPFSSKQTIKE